MDASMVSLLHELDRKVSALGPIIERAAADQKETRDEVRKINGDIERLLRWKETIPPRSWFDHMDQLKWKMIAIGLFLILSLEVGRPLIKQILPSMTTESTEPVKIKRGR